MGLPKRPGELNRYSSAGGSSFGLGLPDVMDLDRDTLDGHLLAELLRDHGPVAIFGGVQVFDLHGGSPARFQLRFLCP
jgi:hypothetical protein